MTTENILKNIIISKNGASFDSHEIIIEFAHKNQNLYIDELNKIKAGTDIPFQTLHSKLGSQIKNICTELGYKSEESRSPDIFRQNSKCRKWSK